MQRRHFLSATLAAGIAPGIARAAAAPIRIGQIGTRHGHASGKLATILKYPKHFQCAGVVEPDGARWDRIKGRPPWNQVERLSEEALFNTPGLQVVAVETAVAGLVPTAARCIDAGFHVHLDKPPGKMAAYRALHAAAAARKRTIQMGYMLRYNPGFQLMYRAARSGWLGRLFEINATMGKTVDEAARRDLNVPGGAMFELGCHLIDSAVTLLGKPDRVVPFLQRTRADGLQDNTLAVLVYPAATATIRVALVEYEGFRRRQFTACGDQGTVDIKPLEAPKVRLALSRARENYKRGYQDVELPRSPGRYDGEFLDLAKIIRGEKTPDWSPDHDLAVHETVLKACGIGVE